MYKFNKKAISIVTVFTMLLSLVFIFPEFSHSSANDINLSSFNFSALGDSYPGVNETAYTFKNVMSKLGQDASFNLSAPYNTPSSYWIIIEDRSDLINWATRCYLATTAVERKFYLSARYKLGNDINAANANIIPIGMQGLLIADETFTGHFDGQGFEITNLSLSIVLSYYREYHNPPEYNRVPYPNAFFANQYYGMFSMVSGIVENVGLRDPAYNASGFDYYQLCGSLVGINYGTVKYSYVITNDNPALRHHLAAGSQQAGVVHTNAIGGTVDSVYLGGGLTSSSPAAVTYNPVVYNNSGTLTTLCYDNTKYTEAVTNSFTAVSGATTSSLQQLNNVLGLSSSTIYFASPWYRDQYYGITNYPTGYPRLCGLKMNNYNVIGSASNPYYIMRPADIIFLSKALVSYPLFSSAATRYFSLYNCIDMSAVSEDAYICSTTPFYGTLAGTAQGGVCTCGSAHPGTGNQTASHCIVNLRIKSYIQSGASIFQGMFYSTYSTATTFTNLNFVGGKLLLPDFEQNEIQGNTVIAGLIMSSGGNTTLNNVHSSANVAERPRVVDSPRKYYDIIYTGGLIGRCSSYLLSIIGCSTSGSVEPGVYTFANSGTSSAISAVGGMIGLRAGTTSSSTVFTLSDSVNFGNVKGITFTERHSGTSANAYPYIYIGGIMGSCSNYSNINNVVNTGTIRSFDPISNPDLRPINTYAIGGIFGTGPLSFNPVVTDGSATTKMDNKGTIIAEAVRNNTTQASTMVYVSGVVGTSSSSSANRGISGAVNNGEIVIAEDVPAIRAAGIISSSMVVTNSQSKGRFTNTLGSSAPLKLNAIKWQSSIAGMGGVSNTTTNTLNIDAEISNNTAAVYMNGLSYDSATSINSINQGNLGVKVTNGSAAVYVNGSNYGTSDGSSNEGAINVDVVNALSTVYINGICQGVSSNGAVNSGSIAVNIISADATGATVFTSGISYGASTDCINSGSINLNATDTRATYTYVSGISSGTAAINNCTNNGSITAIQRNSTTNATNLYVSGISANYNSSGVAAGCKNNAPITVKRILPSNTSTTAIGVYVTGIKSNASSNTATVTDCENTALGIITVDCYYETPNVTNNLTPTVYVSGITDTARTIDRCINRGNIIIGNEQTFCATNAYVSGVFRQVSTSGLNNDTVNSYYVANCQNFGTIKNGANIGEPGDAKVARNIFFSGIGYTTSCYTYQCVNNGNIQMTDIKTGMSPAATGTAATYYYISGLFYTNSVIDAYRSSSNSGLSGLANTGTLTFNTGSNTISSGAGNGNWTGRVFVSGVITALGTSATANPVDRLNTGNLVNTGAIDVNLFASSYPANISSNSLLSTSTTYNASVPTLVIGGISAIPGHTATAGVEKQLNGCANLGNINAAMTGAGANGLVFNVGGIAGNTANSANTDNLQRTKIYNSVNGGAINVTAPIPGASQLNNSYQCGVGGILGYAYQRGSASVTSLNNGVYNSVNFGSVTGVTASGGIVGRDACDIKDVLNFGTISSANDSLARAGGIVGSIYFHNRTFNAASPMFSIMNAVNYGTITQNAASEGSILGELNTFTAAANGSRIISNVINAAGATAGNYASLNFIDNARLGNQGSSFSCSRLYDIAPSAVSYTNNTITTTAKNVNPETDGNSIYNPLFAWRDNPVGLDSWIYLIPEDSARNTLSGALYTPYINGIFAVSDSRGIGGDCYPSANIYLDSCNPVNPKAIVGSDQWQTASNAPALLAACRQKRVNDQAEILQLELRNVYNSVATSIRSANVDPLSQEVTFYIVKDNFFPGDYLPFTPYQLLAGSGYTDISDGATFNMSYLLNNIPVTPVYDGVTAVDVGFLRVRAEAGNTKDWTVKFIFKETGDMDTSTGPNPLEVTEVREGASITNGSAAASYTSKTITERTTTLSPDREFDIIGDVSSIQNTTLILFLDTLDMQFQNYLTGRSILRTEDVSLQTADGSQTVSITADSATSYEGYSQITNSTASLISIDYLNYKVQPLDPTRTNVVVDDYQEYCGKMTLNVRLHVNLPAGNYRIKFHTVYGDYYFYFTRELSKITDILNSPNIFLLSGNLAMNSKNSAAGTLTHTGTATCQYGNAPDLSRLFLSDGTLTDPLVNGIFNTKPMLVAGAAISNFRVDSIVKDDINRTAEYIFKFNITAADGVTVQEWTMTVKTLVVIMSIDGITGYFGTRPYTQSQATDMDYVEEYFFINEENGQSITMNYSYINSSTTNVFNLNQPVNFEAEVYRNGILLSPAEYSDYLILNYTFPAAGVPSFTVQALSLEETGEENRMPQGKYEIRGVYRRSGAPIDLSYTDTNGDPVYPLTDGAGNVISELSWDDIPYTTFTFYKQKGRKLSHALELILPTTPIEVKVTPRNAGAATIIWNNTTNAFDYNDFNNFLGFDALTEENAKAYRHSVFDIDVIYKRAYAFGNFSPDFVLQTGAKLQWYIGSDPDGWESVDLNEDDWSSTNFPTNFSGDRVVHYRVLAENTNYWQYYNLTLKMTDAYSKEFNIDFDYTNFTPDDNFNVSAVIKDADIGYNQVWGNLTFLNNLDSSFIPEFLPPGEFLFDVHVPYGYEATVIINLEGQGDVTPYYNDFMIDGRPVKGTNWIFINNEFYTKVTVTVQITKKNMLIPWGIYKR